MNGYKLKASKPICINLGHMPKQTFNQKDYEVLMKKASEASDFNDITLYSV